LTIENDEMYDSSSIGLQRQPQDGSLSTLFRADLMQYWVNYNAYKENKLMHYSDIKTVKLTKEQQKMIIDHYFGDTSQND